MPGRIPGGIIPGGGPIPGGIPIGGMPGGPMPGRGGGIPGGMPIMPGGGPIPGRGGGMPIGGGPPGRIPGCGGPPGGAPIGGPPGPPAATAGGGRITGAACIWGRGIMTPGAGPPTPRAGPAKPAGAWPGAPGMPLPAALPTPGPAGATCVLLDAATSEGGGPSIVSEITSSPRRSTSPRTLRSSLSSSDFPFLGGSLRYSSASPNTRFMWRSYAINLPIICRPSKTVTLIL